MKGRQRNLCPCARSLRGLFTAPSVRAMMVTVRAMAGGVTLPACAPVRTWLPVFTYRERSE
jgi:hypothetical protein